MANLKALRDRVLRIVGLQTSASPELKDSVNESINDALTVMPVECPILFKTKEYVVGLEPDVLPANSLDTFAATRVDIGLTVNAINPWVITGTQIIGTSSNPTVWKNDRSWDGRTIWLKNGAGQWYKNKIRTVWFENLTVNVTLHKPLDTVYTTFGPFTEWRVTTEVYNLPSEISALTGAFITDGTTQQPVSYRTEGEAIELFHQRYGNMPAVTGVPYEYTRAETSRLQAPTQAPTVALILNAISGINWRGTEPPGKFDYCCTYGMGKVDPVLRNEGVAEWDGYPNDYLNTGTSFDTANNGGARIREFRWESEASPISPEITTAIPDQGVPASAIKITVPNIEYALGFLMRGSDSVAPTTYSRINQSQSGVWVRIWRRRKTANFTNYSSLAGVVHNGQIISGLVKLEFDNAFHLLAEIRIDGLNSGEFIDDGSFIPDYSRRLHTSGVYQGFRLYPAPDKRYMLVIKAVSNPKPLVDDFDTLEFDDALLRLLICRAAGFQHEKMGNLQLSTAKYAEYKTFYDQLNSVKGISTPMSKPITRSLTRAPVDSSGRYLGRFRAGEE